MGNYHKIAVTIKPTMACNMHCRHCFKGDLMEEAERLPLSSAKRFLELAAEFAPDVKVTFHGGEPSLAGPAFYQEFYRFEDELAARTGAHCANRFTTNGLLLTGSLLDALIEHDVLIKISFDGPYNDRLRKETEIVAHHIEEARLRGAKIIIFCTLAREASNHLLELYQWFNERRLDFKILPLEPHGYAQSHAEMLLNPAEFQKSLLKAYDFWLHDKDCKISFSTFEALAALRRGHQFKPFWFEREIALNPDGHIYPFGRPNDLSYDLGRPEEVDRLEKCFTSSVYERLIAFLKKQRASFCQGCISRSTCQGVVLFMSYMYVSEEPLLRYSCSISKTIFETALKANEYAYAALLRGEGDQFNPKAKQQLLLGHETVEK